MLNIRSYFDTIITGLRRHGEFCGYREVKGFSMTANAFAKDVHAAKTVGINERIAKPLDLNTLARILKKWITR